MDITWFEIVFTALMVAFHLAAYVTYNLSATQKKSKPNILTWLIFASLTTMGSYTYFKMSDRDVAVSAIPIISSVCTIITLCVVAKKATFSKPKRNEGIAVVMLVLAILVVRSYQDQALANILTQIGFAVAFYPTITGVRKDPTKEHVLPWMLWTVACITWIILVIFRYKHWVQFVGPLNMLARDILIAYYAHQAYRTK